MLPHQFKRLTELLRTQTSLIHEAINKQTDTAIHEHSADREEIQNTVGTTLRSISDNVKAGNQQAKASDDQAGGQQETLIKLQRWLVFWAACAFFAAFGYGIVAFWQGCLMRRTYEKIQIQADAAKRANSIAYDALHLSERAYVGVEPSWLTNFNPGDTTTIQISVTNFGETPAYNTHVFVDAKILTYPLPHDSPFPFVVPAGTKFGSQGAIYPHAPLPSGKKMDKSLTRDEALTILNGTTRRLYVGGTVWYDDIFGERHCTRYLASLGGQELVDFFDGVKRGKPATGVPWRLSEKYNDNDKCTEHY